MKRAHSYIKDQGGRVEIDQPNAISFYNKTMGGVARMDQNIGAYMINIHNKKWWWLLFRFCVDLDVNNAFQLYRLQPLNQGQKRLDLLGFRREIVNCPGISCKISVRENFACYFPKKTPKESI